MTDTTTGQHEPLVVCEKRRKGQTSLRKRWRPSRPTSGREPALLDVPMHLRIDRELDVELRRRAAD